MSYLLMVAPLLCHSVDCKLFQTYNKAKKKIKCVYGHMIMMMKKIRVGRSEIYFF